MLPEEFAGVSERDVSDKIIAVTGATSGIGRAAAVSFGRLGATVIVIGRNKKRARGVLDRLGSYEADCQFYTEDFTNMSAVRDLASRITNDFDCLDILINNAGSIFRNKTFTSEGFEKTIAINYLAAFQLTHDLSTLLMKSSDPHVLNVSSNGHRFSNINTGKFEYIEDYSAFDAYNRSKLALLCFSLELASRSTKIRSNSLHPGFIPNSSFYRRFPSLFQKFLPVLQYIPQVVIRRPIVTVNEAAGTIIYAAQQDSNGNYYEENNIVQPSSEALDKSAQKRLWEFSADRLNLNRSIITSA